MARHVAVGAGGAVSRQGGEHDRVDLLEHVVAEPEAGKCTGLLGLDDHVGGGDEFLVERLALLGLRLSVMLFLPRWVWRCSREVPSMIGQVICRM